MAPLYANPTSAIDGLPGTGLPRGPDLPITNPDYVRAIFVRRTLEYFASRGVPRFIIWNEPDTSVDIYGYEFAGALDDYFHLLKVAIICAKTDYSSGGIHLAGTIYWHGLNFDGGRT